ncbi:phosphoglycerate kinase [Frankia sp. CNm7]|uniref:Phosphoglycerate kinase n=1 Tax=Frankia nepalensis TaxID=1836974 RepID=A0A937RH57_9ACTN|nr:phosphoglycerate kinase [Frankia nepalensis]MBL7499956.1 phosphoglycerate kinase [Frankia nepalensis]MBL7515058.1 phosphoglycerate kinase [Frankia nepalensis]MBL7524724.1 phosphoglycerate kinase [Frankia nepalensis]MBL7632136.1 phosphoglycerate kinase [Frankia nepalensis]
MRTIDDLQVAGRRVLVRSDLNVPLDRSGDTPRITDDGRVLASAPTIRTLAERGARVVVCSHLGRPKGEYEEKYSLAPVAARLSEVLGERVAFTGDGTGDIAGASAADVVAGLADGEVALLDNLRFHPGETSKDAAARAAFADQLAALAEFYVGDAFGAVHRAHASVSDVPKRLPHAAGGLVLAELGVLRSLTGDARRPYAVVLGGSKVSDKLGVIRALLPKVDALLVGGGMCFTFLAAQGHGVGASLLESEMIDTCKDLLAEGGDRIVLPTDVVIADRFAADAATAVVPAAGIRDGWLGLDIGPESTELFAGRLADARTVFWNGPMGVFELAPFAAGTKGVAEAVAARGAPGQAPQDAAFTVVGGGDSAAAVRTLGIPEASFSHISTGGGASLEFLEGKTLPGIAALEV